MGQADEADPALGSLTSSIGTLRRCSAKALSRKLLDLLDGTRDSATLIEDFAAFDEPGEVTLESEGERVSEPAQIRKLIAAGLPQALNKLARTAILLR